MFIALTVEILHWSNDKQLLLWRLYLHFIDSQATIWKYLAGDITDPVSKFLESSSLNSLFCILKESSTSSKTLRFVTYEIGWSFF